MHGSCKPKTSLLVVSVLACSAGALAAQRPLGRGSRVRVWTEGTAIVGTVQARDDSSLVLIADGIRDTIVVPYRTMAGLELSRGRHPRVWPMIISVVAGGMVGGVIDGSVRLSPAPDTAQPGWPTMAGMAVGALVGSRFRADSWTPVKVPAPAAVAAAAQPGGAAPGAPAYGVPGAPGNVPMPTDLRSLDQPPPGEFAPGARIRYSTRDLPVVRSGRVLRVDGDTLTVQPDAAVGVRRVPLGEITRLDVSVGGHRHTIKGLLLGGAIGAVVGGVAAMDPGVTAGLDSDEVAASALFVAGVGAEIGAVAGALTRNEGWRAVERPSAPRPVSVGLSRARGRLHLGLTLRP